MIVIGVIWCSQRICYIKTVVAASPAPVTAYIISVLNITGVVNVNPFFYHVSIYNPCVTSLVQADPPTNIEWAVIINLRPASIN